LLIYGVKQLVKAPINGAAASQSMAGPAMAAALSSPMPSDATATAAESPGLPDEAPAADTADAVWVGVRKDNAVAIARTADKTARVLVVLFIVTQHL
jgi:hypothetical protein